jgi:citrate lyase subunit beta/citryl-CoA lyase
MTLLRSLLFIPGNKPNMLARAASLTPDVFVPDMEDSVPAAEKANARNTIKEHLPQLAAGGAKVLPRVNALDTGLIEADLEAVIGPHIRGISVGKIDSAAAISRVSALMAERERAVGIEIGSLSLIPWVESAAGIVNCHPICVASRRIVAVAFGGEDFTHDMAVERLDDESQLSFARWTISTAARAADIAALDTPYFRFRDQAGLESTSLAVRQQGFRGRFAIHPDQIETINRCFSPSAAEVAEAKRIVAAFEEAERNGRGSTSLDGRVIDVPVVKRARALLTVAALTGSAQA